LTQENPGEKPPRLTKEEEAEPKVEKTFLKISLFDFKMIVIASTAMVFSIICGMYGYIWSQSWPFYLKLVLSTSR
jgi:hypothetical protein